MYITIMVDFNRFEQNCRLGFESDVVIEFSMQHLDIVVDGTGYHLTVEVRDNYIGEERDHMVRSHNADENLASLIEKEKEKLERVKKAKKLEHIDEINGWTQVGTSGSEFIKFVNVTEELTIELDENDQWLFDNRVQESITTAKCQMLSELESRNVVAEYVNGAVEDMLKEELREIKGIGKSGARTLTSNAIPDGSEPVDTLDDIRFRRSKNLRRNIPSKARSHFKEMDVDPVKQVVQEKKRELVQEYDKTELFLEAL